MIDLNKWLKENRLTLTEFIGLSGISYGAAKKYAEKGADGVRYNTAKKIEQFISSYQGEDVVSNPDDYKPAAIDVDELWKFLPKEVSFITKDENGSINGWNKRPVPKYDNKEWSCPDGRAFALPLLVKFNSDSWDGCLVERPYNFWDYLGKDGLFIDDVDMPVFGRLTGISERGTFQRNNGFYYENFRPLTENEKDNLA